MTVTLACVHLLCIVNYFVPGKLTSHVNGQYMVNITLGGVGESWTDNVEILYLTSYLL